MLAMAHAGRGWAEVTADTPQIPAVDGAAATSPGALTLLGVTLNRRVLDGDTILAVRDGQSLVPVEDLKRWRLRLGPAATIDIDGQAFAPLSAVPGLEFQVDAEKQILVLTAEPDAFEASAITYQPRFLPPTEAARTAYLNYDLSVERSDGRPITAAFIETGASDARGMIANTMTIGNALNGHGAVRLDTYAIRDNPAGLTRLQIGDGVTRGASWAPNVRFGGLRFGTDFSLQPGYLSFPTPTFGGRASLPSNVELYVNDVLDYQSKVREGPFTLDRLPVVAGAGRATLVVRDALGIERRIASNYYVSTELLRPGTADYSVELGAERQRYGQVSFDYGRPFVAGSYRAGVASALTVESRVELGYDLRGLGGGVTTIIGNFAEISGAVALSDGPAGTGHLYRLSAARLAADWTFAITYQATSRDYVQIGLAERDDRPRRLFQASFGTTIRQLGNFSASVAYLRRADNFRSTIYSANYGRSIGENIYLTAFALRSDASGAANSATTIGASLSIALGARRSLYLQADTRQRRAEFQRTVPDDKGFGYRLVAGEGIIGQQQADLTYRGRAIDITGQVSRFGGDTAERVVASGAFVLADGAILPTRRLDGAFAIVDAGGQKGIEVLQDNRPVAKTNRNGLAVVTRLRPYEANRVSLAPGDLPLDATLGTDTLVVVPRYSAGARAHFDVRGGHAGTLIVTLRGGQPIDPGTPLTIEGADRAVLAGFGGEIFLDNLVEGTNLLATTGDGKCRVRVPTVPKDMLPRLGPVICEPVAR
jgi:outer membrane usher protein